VIHDHAHGSIAHKLWSPFDRQCIKAVWAI
jgi:hypothetical protein